MSYPCYEEELIKLAALSAEWPEPVGKPTDLMRLELTTMPFAGICSTTELPVHIGQVGSVATW